MIFSSLDFLLFFVFVLVFLKILENRSEDSKKLFLLVVSYYFYAYWDWRFLSLILLNTAISYIAGKYIYLYKDNDKYKKLFLTISVVSSLTILGVFKYYNFFIDSLNTALSLEATPLSTMNIILPLGISFYTFQTLSYTIDIYRKHIKPSNLLDFSLFVVFFPQLVAGPIVRASEFLPQLKNKIQLKMSNFKVGAALFIVGFAKKSLLADSLSIYVDSVFITPELFDGMTLFFATMAYSLQIYFDFSGYTDMAIGIGIIIGFQFPKNFDYPYKSRNITEFWRRWHLTLSRWLRDYLYISLGGNRKGKYRTYFNLFATMTLGGLWHGASLNFLLWGMLHGIALTVHKVYMTINKQNISRMPAQAFSSLKFKDMFSDLLAIIFTYLFICLTWILFRANSFDDTYTILYQIITMGEGVRWIHISFYLIVPLFLLWQLIPDNLVIRAGVFNFNNYSGFIACSILVILIVIFAPTGLSPFIYFQF
ncbi:MAG: MBOAT family O-acyltransferase [Methylococcales bacterium]